MRVTNSMLVNNFMNNLNTNLTRLDKLQNQLASGRKFAHISDDPVALIYSQAARNKLIRLSHYQSTIETAQDWLASVESGLMELEGRVADVYVSVIDAATDVKGAADKNNVAQLIGQLRDHYLDTLNATFGDKYIYAGYNTPGDDAATKRITGPFTLDNEWNLHYNGQNMSNLLGLTVDGATVFSGDVSGIFGGLRIDISDGNAANAVTRVEDAITAINGSLTTPTTGGLLYKTADVNARIESKSSEIGVIAVEITTKENQIADIDKEIMEKYGDLQTLNDLNAKKDAILNDPGGLKDLRLQDSTLNKELSELFEERDGYLADLRNVANVDIEFDPSGRVALSIGGMSLIDYDTVPSTSIPFLGVTDNTSTPPAAPTVGSLDYIESIIDMISKLKSDVLTFDVGPGVSMQVTFNGIDLVMFQAPDNTTLNVFNLLHEVYEATSSGAPAEEIGSFITSLQYAQNHLLAKTAEIGGRTNRLDLLTARYKQDELNYEQMKSNAEDADLADVIMYQKMAEAVYQAALSTGARIIQPTLMDFLR